MVSLSQEPKTLKERVEFLLQVYAGWQDHGSDPTYAMDGCQNGDCYCQLPEKLIQVIRHEDDARKAPMNA